jgi:hypothetical protein
LHDNVEQTGIPYHSASKMVEENEKMETQLQDDGISSGILLFKLVRINNYNTRHWI